ncbi:hypothetical protein [Nocardia brasiliensis]|uniref:hypothetical protein n=1 Tax=Nocardia brasiliensis TaxID=37326 RepID=UPI00189300C4|nr:hypothetical protein [Nocardia brasiliensis]MBF6125531.1 hypothetical protein [Nocardia brasiliensis]
MLRIVEEKVSFATVDAALEDLRVLDRTRDMIEIRARATGIPDTWIAHARRMGHTGQPWSGDHRLPRTPHRLRAGRPHQTREDMAQMTEMAALFVVREHQLTTPDGTVEPDPAAADQFRRNLRALRTRALLTADAIEIGSRSRAQVFTVSDQHLAGHIAEYVHYSLPDLHAVFYDHASPSTAASVRRSLKQLRRVHPALDTATTDPGRAQPPDLATLIERARDALQLTLANDYRDLVLSEPAVGLDIGTAIAATTRPAGSDPEPVAVEADPVDTARPAEPELDLDP